MRYAYRLLTSGKQTVGLLIYKGQGVKVSLWDTDGRITQPRWRTDLSFDKPLRDIDVADLPPEFQDVSISSTVKVTDDVDISGWFDHRLALRDWFRRNGIIPGG
jgi:uncharacterized protein YegJ (DUF2314 family)